MIKLKDKYKKEVIPQMMEMLGCKSPMAVPSIRKVVVNTGFGREAVAKTGDEQKKLQEAALESLSFICGQRAVLTKAKKAISSFKLRKGMPIGVKVTLRGKRMYDFLERVINIVLPRSRDFRGINPKSLDNEGNLTIAIKEQIAFPEISAERARQIFGLEITVATNAKKRESGLELLRLMGFPIKT
jgi:large subunit ribosomal protein L5